MHILIIKNLKVRESCMHVLFNNLITISIYVFTTKVKLHEQNSMNIDQRLPKNLSGSKCTQIRLKMWHETLIF